MSAEAPRRTGGLAAFSQSVAFDLVASVYPFITSNATWRDSCRAMGALVDGPRILDLGVGPGASALERATADRATRYIGLDLSQEMLRQAGRAARALGVELPLIRSEGTSLPIRDGSLDGVTGHSLLYLLPDAPAALAEVRRVLRPGGRAAFLEPRAGRPALRDAFFGGARCAASLLLWRVMSGLHTRFDEAGLVALLERAGLRRARAWPVLAGYGVMAVAERTDG